MSSREFAAWMAYARTCPIGDERADLRTAQLAHTVARAGGRKTRATDFIVNYWQDPAERAAAAAQNMVTRLQLYAAAHNGSLR